MRFEHKSWSEMLLTGPYRKRKVLAITSNELNVIFVVDIMTWWDWMSMTKKFINRKKGVCHRNANQ